jgi:hypothetical protein
MGFAEAVEEFGLLRSGGRIEAGFVGRVPGRTILHSTSLPALQFREQIGFLAQTGRIIPQPCWLVQAESTHGPRTTDNRPQTADEGR